MSDYYTRKIETVTFNIRHSPNCPKKYEVRLVGKRAGRIDLQLPEKSKDIVGYGDTLEEAAREAWIQRYPEDSEEPTHAT